MIYSKKTPWDLREGAKMFNLKLYGALLLALMLAACGGNDVVTSPEAGSPEDGSDEIIVESIQKPRLGIGSGDSFLMGSLEVSLTDISAGGNVQVSANIVDIDQSNTKISSESYSVEFSSSCSDKNKAEFSESKVETSSGSVSVTYTAKGCVGEDAISARLYKKEGENALLHTATAVISVAAAEVGAISFVETASPTLSIRTIANPVLPTHTTVTFKVVDKFGDPIAEKEVNFTLGNSYNDVELARDSNVTDSAGMVSAIVNSGTTHAIAIVNATTLASDGQTIIRTSSQPISITTGLPVQKGFSISAKTFNPAAYNVDGVEVEITVRATDAFGNFVPSGTVVNFTAESGGINSFCEIGEDGACSATWRSSGIRPGAKGPKNDGYGLTTILAYTLGEAGFEDKNSDYIFDDNEDFSSYGEPFRDDNWNNGRDATEFYVDTDNNGQYSQADRSIYQGALCSSSAKVLGHCESLMHVRGELRIVQSYDDKPVILVFKCAGSACSKVSHNDLKILDTTDGGDFYIVLQDINGSMPSSGTTLSIEQEDDELYDIRADEGAVDNTIGLLAGTSKALGFSGLPEFGMMYRVEYKPNTVGAGGYIKINAANGDKTSFVYLDVAP